MDSMQVSPSNSAAIVTGCVDVFASLVDVRRADACVRNRSIHQHLAVGFGYKAIPHYIVSILPVTRSET